MKKNIIRIILLICLIGVFYLIFQFSAENGDESRDSSHGFITNIINVFNSNMDEQEKQAVVENVDTAVRKLAHFSIYMVVGVLSMSFISTYNLNKNKRIIISTAIGFVYSISDEIHQYFVPERSAEITDILIDTLRSFYWNNSNSFFNFNI